MNQEQESLKIVRRKFFDFMCSAKYHDAGHFCLNTDPSMAYPLPVGMSGPLDWLSDSDPIDVARAVMIDDCKNKQDRKR